MPTLYDTRTRKRINANPAEVPTLLRENKAAFGEPYAYLKDEKRGVSFKMPVSDPALLQGLSQGAFRLLEDDEELQLKQQEIAAESPIAAGAFGAVKGATLGLAAPAIRAAGASTKTLEALASLERANPTASALGEFGSVFGSLLGAPVKAGAKLADDALRAAAAPSTAANQKTLLNIAKQSSGALVRGADDLAAQAGRKATQALIDKSILKPGTLASQVLGASARGAVEGAIYGTGQALHESALGDEPLTAEYLMSHIGPSALITGALFGAMPGVGALGKTVGKKAEQVFNRIKGAGADELTAAVKLGTREQAAAKALGITRQEAVAYAGDTAKKTNRLGEAIRTIEELDLGDGYKVINPTATPQQNADRLVGYMQRVSSELGEVYDAAAGISRKAITTGDELAGEIREKMAKAFGNLPGGQQYLGEVDNIIERALKPAGENLFGDLNMGGLRDIRSHIRNLMEQKKVENTKNPYLQVYRPIERIINEKMQGEIADLYKQEGLLPRNAEMFKKLQEQYHKLSPLTDEIAKRSLKEQVAPHPTMLQDAVTSIPATGLGFAAGGVPGAVAGYMGGQLFSAGKRALEQRLPSFQYAVAKNGSILGAVEEIAIGSKKRSTREALNAASNFLSTAKSIAPAAAKAAVLTSVPGATTDEQRAARVADSLRAKRQATLAALDSEIYASMGDVAPNISMQASQITNRAYDILEREAPVRPPDASRMIQAPNPKWETSTLEAKRFLRIAEAIDNPGAEIERASRGDVNIKALRAIQEVYPTLYSEMMSNIISETYASDKPVDIRSRSVLGILLEGFDPTQAPAYIQAMQEAARFGQEGGTMEGQQQATQINRLTNRQFDALEAANQATATSTDLTASGTVE